MLMKTPTLALLITLTTQLVAGRAAGQQAVTSDVLETIRETGTIDRVVEQLSMNGCPQVDARGRAAFDVLASAQLPVRAVAELGMLWSYAFAHCNYAPLQGWYERALEVLAASGDHGQLITFVRALPSDIPNSMREILWREVDSQPQWLGDYSYELASTAVGGTSPTEMVERSLAAFRDHRVSREWIGDVTGALIRNHPGMFMRALAARSSSIPDQALGASLGVIAGAVRAGRLAGNTDGLATLRASVARREGIPANIRALGTPN